MEKFAIFSDIHSNVFALQACIDDALRQGAKKFVNLGDIFYGPIAPQKTYELLSKYDFITIRGNQDRQILQASKEELEQNKTLQFIVKDLSKEAIKWLEELPFDIQINEEIYACHGGPKNDTAYLLEKIQNNTLHVKTQEKILKEIEGKNSPIILCGHSHLAKCVTLLNHQTIINVGSVGLPAYKDDEPIPHCVENFSPHATYTLLEKIDTNWNINFQKVSYDVKSAISCAKKRGRDDWAWFLKSGRV